MKRHPLALIPVAAALIVCAFVLTPGSVWAQGYGGTGNNGPGGYFGGHSDNPVGPTVSPYLNLLNLGNQLSGVPTYQALVKPLEDQRQDSQQQQADINRLQHDVRNPSNRTGPIRGTGSYSGGSQNVMKTRFQNYSHYYSFKGR